MKNGHNLKLETFDHCAKKFYLVAYIAQSLCRPCYEDPDHHSVIILRMISSSSTGKGKLEWE